MRHKIDDVNRIYNDWNEALSKKDMDAILDLYADDVTLESPLIPHLLEQESGVAEGKDLLRKLLELLFQCLPTKRKFYRKNYFTDGTTLMWEYPRISPDGEQMDFAEVMEIVDGKIQKHRVYWGWYGIRVLKNDEHHQNLDKS